MTTRLLLTCEHGGNLVPKGYNHLFRGARQVLASHRGWDPGSLAMAKTFQRRLTAPLFYNTITRLLVEPNRSLGHRQLFSEFSAGVDSPTREVILERYYLRHRNRIENWIRGQIRTGQTVVHVSLHTFTPRLNGLARNADVGLLYDSGRELERQLCCRWRDAIKQHRAELRVRRNYPYLGKADGFTTYLRSRLPFSRYLGIELEVNQRWPAGNRSEWVRLRRQLATTFQTAYQAS